MEDKQVTRREFVRDGAVMAAGLAAIGAAGSSIAQAAEKNRKEIAKTRSYNTKMEYRQLGKTGLWVSAVCLGGHWKRINKVIDVKGRINPCNSPTIKSDLAPFYKNRREIVNHCISLGINAIDLAGDSEAEVYCKVLGANRDKVYLAYSHPASEMRSRANRKAKKLVELLAKGLKRCKIEYVDIWRCMALERGGRHTKGEVEEMMKALEIAKTKGLCRFTGLSTHDRKWAKMLIETYPELVQVLCFPYTADSTELPKDSIFAAIRKHNVGTFGIKPFASNSLFKGDGSPGGPHAAEDNRRARMAIRYILSNPAITAPIPGLISTAQIDNVVQAVHERRNLNANEKALLKHDTDEMWARLPDDYQWLKDWKYV